MTTIQLAIYFSKEKFAIFHFGRDSMVPEAKDQFIAPKISELLAPNLPDISSKRQNPINDFILNDHLSLVLTSRMRQACFNFIQNAEAAFDEYCAARTSLLGYLPTKDRTVAPYFATLRHFEHCLAHLYQAVDRINVISKLIGKERQFEPNDGSVLARVLILHNHVKHMDQMYREVAIRDEISFKLFATRSDGSKSIPHEIKDVASVPIWITNVGLECRRASLTYSELAEEVMSVLDEAVEMANLDLSNPNDAPEQNKLTK
jgi:hypothetical protein